MCAVMLVVSSHWRLISARVCRSSSRYSAVLSSSGVMATSRRCSSARISDAVAVQAERPVAAVIRALLAAVVLRLSAAATLASVAANGEGPRSSDRKNLGQRLSKSSRMEEWPLLSHLAYTLETSLCKQVRVARDCSCALCKNPAQFLPARLHSLEP